MSSVMPSQFTLQKGTYGTWMANTDDRYVYMILLAYDKSERYGKQFITDFSTLFEKMPDSGEADELTYKAVEGFSTLLEKFGKIQGNSGNTTQEIFADDPPAPQV